MTIIKKAKTRIAPMITHLVNCIIISCTFPDILKITKIIPTHKPGKPIYDIESFRPLNNLCTVEKIIEEYFMTHLESHFEKNNVINKYHHGGRKKHSTTTALINILNTINIQHDKNNIVCVLITDLSKAFNTIEH